jgi:hypothetical protein
MTELCKIAIKYGCDKEPSNYHHYTPFYYELFKNKPVKKLLEIGIFRGSSLRMWRDFFPEAEIFGLDINTSCLISEDRIHSYYCDAGNEDSLNAISTKLEGNFDIIIDDGSHFIEHQILAANTMPKYLAASGIFIIEDVLHIKEVSASIILPHEIKTFGPHPPDDNLIIIDNKTD